MYLDIDKIKNEITMGNILDYYGINLKSNGKNRLSGCCPLHKGDNQNAFHVDLDKNLFNCFTHCGGGSIFDFVMKMEKLSFYKAALKIWKTFYLEYNKQNDSEPYLKLQYQHQYLQKRGIDENIARYFQLGYCKAGIMKNRIAIPIIDIDKKCVAYCGRTVDENVYPKYLFPKHFKKSKYLFNIQNILPCDEKPVFIVEGFFDCIHISKLGFDAIALMGRTISIHQLNLLKQINRFFILMLDGDKAGQEAMTQIKKEMTKANLDFKSVYLIGKKEPELLDYYDLLLISRVL
jgi:DNA primase